MDWKNRNGEFVKSDEVKGGMLHFLYESRLGGLVLPIMIKPFVSNAAGWLLSKGVSRIGIASFLKKNDIDMSQYEQRRFDSFNDFFTRKVLPEKRPVDMVPEHLISPCDSKLSVWDISEDSTFYIKGGKYTLESLLRNKELADSYSGGILLQFRLTVDDYHRYCYPDDGIKGESVKIAGVYYTVNPVAYKNYAVYKENTREYEVLKSKNFGDIILMEIGATMVGRISNEYKTGSVKRGEEKGHFDFGGSSIIVCIKKGLAVIDEDIVKNTSEGYETIVKYGEKIGQKK